MSFSPHHVAVGKLNGFDAIFKDDIPKVFCIKVKFIITAQASASRTPIIYEKV